MRDLMFQTWPDSDHRWHWVAFTASLGSEIESSRSFDSRDEAEWDAKRFIATRH